MAMKYDTRSCTVTQDWEWVVTGYTPTQEETKTLRKSVTVSQKWVMFGGIWNEDGAATFPSTVDGMTYVSGTFSMDVPPWTPSHSAPDNTSYTTTGSGYADYTGKVTTGGEPIHGWGASGNPYHNASNSITYDDGIYAGTIYLDSVSGSPSPPSYNGSSIGETGVTSTSGTANYSGDVPAKDTGGETDPNPTLGIVATNITSSSVTAVIQGLQFEASYYHMFEVELWNSDATTHILTESWADPSTNKYSSVGFNILQPNTTYTLKGFSKSTSTSGRNHVGNVTFSTNGTSATRPANWTWTTLTPTAITYTSGKAKVNLVAASEWINFCSKINDFRSYKGLGALTFTTAYTTGDFTEAMYDEARLAIAAMATVNNPSGYYSKLVALKDALNSIT
jgi:hypothetical protein